MKKYFLPVVFLLLAIVTDAQVTWSGKNIFSGQPRFKAAGFDVNGKGYVVGGRVSNSPVTYTNDVWEYDPIDDTWTQKLNFTYAVVQPVSFSIGNKGYVVGGAKQGSNPPYVNSTNEYDPALNTWTARADYPGNGIGGASAFVINGKAYVGVGADNGSGPSSDLYEYNPANNTWTQKTSFPGALRVNTVSFTIGNFGYVGLGTDGQGGLKNDFYKYNPATDSWSAVATMPGRPRMEAMALVVNGKAYVGGGSRYIGSQYFALADMYEYDPATNSWSSAPGIPGLPRNYAATFSINDKGYMIGGNDYDGNLMYKMVDMLSDCSLTTNITSPDLDINNMAVKLYPNPTSDMMNVELSDIQSAGVTYQIMNIEGRILASSVSKSESFSFSTRNMASGFYLLVIKDEKGNTSVNRFEVFK